MKTEDHPKRPLAKRPLSSQRRASQAPTSIGVKAAFGEDQSWFEKAFQFANIGMAVVSMEGEFLRVNQAICRFFGYSEEELLRLRFQDVTHPDDLARSLELAAHTIDAQRDVTLVEKRYIHRDGSLLWGQLSYSVVRSNDGTDRYFLGQLEDITLRKSAEAQNRRFVAVVEHSSDMIAMASIEDQRMIYVNQTGCQLVGLTQSEVTDKHIRDFHSRKTWQFMLDSVLPIIIETGRWEGVSQLRHFQTKELIDVHLSAFLVKEPDGAGAFFAAIMRDVREQKIAQDALRESEARFRRAFQHAPIGMALVSPEGRYIKVNDALCQMLGYSSSELLKTSFLELTYEEDLSRGEDVLRQALAGRFDSGRSEKRYVHKSGRLVRVQVSFSLLRDLRDRPLYFIAQIRDITEARRAEQELKDSHQQLRQLSSHLQTVREEERVQIAREIHDELGQAMTALKLDLAWVRKGLEPGQQRLRQQVHEMASRADDTIGSLRRILSQLRPTILDDLGLIAAIEWQVKDFQERTQIQCSLSFDCEEWPLDEKGAIAVFRIFQEALTNIARHASASRVWVSIHRDKGRTLLTVRDNGVGIDPVAVASTGALGILGMRERAGLLGGDFRIRRVRPSGTEIELEVPVQTLNIKDGQ